MAAIEIEIRQKCFYLHIFCYSLLDSTLLELKEINKASSPLSNGLLVKLSSEKSRKLFLFRHCHVLLREYKQYIFSWFYTLKTFLEQGINKGKIRKISLRYSNFFFVLFHKCNRVSNADHWMKVVRLWENMKWDGKENEYRVTHDFPLDCVGLANWKT